MAVPKKIRSDLSTFCSLIQDDEVLINTFASETRKENNHKKLWA